MRYAEVLLNLAECAAEVGNKSDEVYTILKDIRKRAGITANADGLYGLKANMSQQELIDAVLYERRIELAFEEHRYWDIRRWRLAEQVYAQPIQGMYITKSQTSTTYVPQAVLNVQWDNKRYFYPIPYSEVIKNKNMVQNPNW